MLDGFEIYGGVMTGGLYGWLSFEGIVNKDVG